MAKYVVRNISFYARVVPERLTAGLLTVLVRNDNGVDDAIDEYFEGWRDASTQGKAEKPFSNTQPADPGRTGYGHSIGDYDVFVFLATVASHLGSVEYNGTLKTRLQLIVDNFEDTTAGIWYTVPPTHKKCQSFVRYDLISRMNNGYDNPTTIWKFPQVDDTYTGSGAGAVTLSQENILNTSRYEHGFGTNLSSANNTYFPPVNNITISGLHGIATASQHNGSYSVYKLVTHNTSFYNLKVNIGVVGYNDGSDHIAYFKNRINVFFQPFGETAEFEFSITEFTS